MEMKDGGRKGWNPNLLRKQREEHGLTLESTGQAVRDVAEKHGLEAMAANFQTLWAHENGDSYPGPHYRRAYCLLYGKTEPELGFRPALSVDQTDCIAGPEAVPIRISAPATPKEQLARLITAPEQWTALLTQFRGVLTGTTRRRCVVLMAGYAGSGKSELSGVISREMGWALIDKDTLTRPLVEDLLSSLGQGPHDRESADYLTHVRPREYECLMDTVYENLNKGVSVVASAPFIKELRNPSWLRQVAKTSDRLQALLVPTWVCCDGPTMREHIEQRAAARDAWKLAHWADYEAGLEIEISLTYPHLVIDNRHGAAVQLCDTFSIGGGVLP
jgi:predicted kinase